MSKTNHPGAWFPLAGLAKDGYSTEDEATATCLCGSVQLAFPPHAPEVEDAFVCNCYDCHKLTASMFASNFTVAESNVKHLRGRENLKTWTQDVTVASGNAMTNYFCITCGGLLYRVSSGAPDRLIMRIGTIDDFSLHDTKLKPWREQFTRGKVSWFPGLEGVPKMESGYGAKF